MARKAMSARKTKEDELPAPTVGRRIAWVAAVGIWVFVATAMLSFDSADWPSHVVAVHNTPAANLCGSVGAVISYWTYQVIGLGSWVLLIGIAWYLGIMATGRSEDQLLLRTVGLLILAISVSSVHALFWPNAGPLAGSHAGLLATWFIGELTPRFSVVGTLLILMAAISVGAIVSMDRIVVLLPRLLGISARTVGRTAGASARALRSRPEVLARKGKKKRVDPATPIDPDAGGIGGTEAFNPDDEALVEDAEADDEYEYEDEVEDDVEDDDDADVEYEYEYEYVDEDDADEDDEEEADAEDDADEVIREPLSAEELRAKIARLPLRMGGKSKDVARDEDIPREESFENYKFPTLDLLEDSETNFSETLESLVRDQAQMLEEALHTYGIEGEVAGIESGPTVTQYAVQLAPGTKVARINAIASDLARSLKAPNIRVVPNMVGRTTIGIEVPNLKREKVRLKELMSGGHAKGMILPMFLGKDASGDPLVADLTRMPHMLIAGTTGSGKSVCMNSIIMSWLYTKRPNELKLVLVDPKMVELSLFAEIPHLMCPVVTEMPRAAAILEWAVTKMEERYELLKEAAVRDIQSYNALTEEELYERFNAETDLERAKIPKRMPYLVFVIDELADLMMTTKEVEHSIVRIAQKARAVGIHLILATQRPQANVVTGLIKSNMPCRVSFKVASGMDSRIVLDQKGAELLLGAGDMLFLTPHTSDLRRAQNVFVQDGELRQVVKFLREVAKPSFEQSLIAIRPGGMEEPEGLDAKERDPLFDQAVEVMIESGRGSVSLLQRRLAIGYSRASRLVDQMCMAGILGDHKGSVAREVLITIDEWQMMRAMEENDNADADLYGTAAPSSETTEAPPASVAPPPVISSGPDSISGTPESPIADAVLPEIETFPPAESASEELPASDDEPEILEAVDPPHEDAVAPPVDEPANESMHEPGDEAEVVVDTDDDADADDESDEEELEVEFLADEAEASDDDDEDDGDDDDEEEDGDTEYEYEYVDEDGNPIDPDEVDEYEYEEGDEEEDEDDDAKTPQANGSA